MNNQKILQENGLKSTPARIAVLDFLEKKSDPTDVLTITESLNSQADQATIYRILDLFSKKGIIERVELGEGKHRYELQDKHHHHLVCINCGSIEDVEVEKITEIESKIKEKKGFLVKSHSLEFFGICRNCQH